ncbi:histone-like nucleoid-structuring protein Lsr2 [Nocardia gipuzkoensis]
MDLSVLNASSLRGVFEQWTPHARKVGRTRRARGRPASDRNQTAAIREWARKKGIEVSIRGRIAAEVLEQYKTRELVISAFSGLLLGWVPHIRPPLQSVPGAVSVPASSMTHTDDTYGAQPCIDCLQGAISQQRSATTVDQLVRRICVLFACRSWPAMSS